MLRMVIKNQAEVFLQKRKLGRMSLTLSLNLPFPQDHKDEVTCVAYNWNDGYIVSGSLSGEIILHSVTTNLSSTPFGYGSRQVGCVKFLSVTKLNSQSLGIESTYHELLSFVILFHFNF